MAYMYVLLIGVFILALFLLYLALKVIRIVLKVFLFIFAAAIMLVVVFGFVAIADIKDVKDHLNTDSTITLKEIDGKYVDGFIYLPGGETEKLEKEDVEKYNDQTMEEIVEGHYKLIIFKPKIIDSEGELPVFQKPITLFKSYKEGEIIIYPELKTTRLIKAMPLSLIDKILKRV